MQSCFYHVKCLSSSLHDTSLKALCPAASCVVRACVCFPARMHMCVNLYMLQNKHEGASVMGFRSRKRFYATCE